MRSPVRPEASVSSRGSSSRPERFAGPSFGAQQPRRGQKVREPGGVRVAGGAIRARGPLLFGRGRTTEISARETQPRHPGHGDGELQIGAGVAGDPLRFASHLQGALLVSPRSPRLREGDVPPHQVADLPRAFGQPYALF